MQGCISHSFYCRRCFSSCTLVTRWSTSILKVGVALVYQVFKEEWAVVIEELWGPEEGEVNMIQIFA